MTRETKEKVEGPRQERYAKESTERMDKNTKRG
jgi:hypothetical protein